MNFAALGYLSGALGSTFVSYAAIKKLLSGCHKEVHQFGSIDGIIEQSKLNQANQLNPISP
jgi:hypothetical protein